MSMVRKQVYLTKELDEKVKSLARSRGVAEAEVIRDALNADGELVESARTESSQREQVIHKLRRKSKHGSGPKFLDLARARDNVEAESPGRSWTREDLYDERPKYLSR